jgi:hypothetical protein
MLYNAVKQTANVFSNRTIKVTVSGDADDRPRFRRKPGDAVDVPGDYKGLDISVWDDHRLVQHGGFRIVGVRPCAEDGDVLADLNGIARVGSA